MMWEKLAKISFVLLLSNIVSDWAAFAKTPTELLLDHRALIETFDPTSKVENLSKLGFTLRSSQQLILDNEKTLQNSSDPDLIEQAKSNINQLKNIDHIAFIDLEKNQTAYSIVINRYNTSSGDDQTLSFEFLKGENNYRKLPPDDFQKCRSEYAKLSNAFGDATVVRDLIDDRGIIPEIYTSTDSFTAQWQQAGRRMTFHCVTFISSQYFFDPGDPIAWTNGEINKKIQSALNHFGFAAGTVDGKIGRKTKNAVRDFQECVGAWGTAKLDQKQLDFLLSAHGASKKIRAASDCLNLQRQVPRQLLSVDVDFLVGTHDRIDLINPITWLQCLRFQQRIEIFQNNVDRTTEPNDLITIGFDPVAGHVFNGESKNIISQDADIRDAAIQYRQSTNATKSLYDRFVTDVTVDRLTGLMVSTIKFYKSNTHVASSTNKSECSKIDHNKSKF